MRIINLNIDPWVVVRPKGHPCVHCMVADTWTGTGETKVFLKGRQAKRTRSSSREAAVIGGEGVRKGILDSLQEVVGW